MTSALIVIIIAFLSDLLIGDPEYRFHPVRLIGSSISFLEEYLLKNKYNEYLSGFFIAISIPLFFSFIYIFIQYVFLKYASYQLHLISNIFVVFSCISLKDLFVHVQKVELALRTSLVDARKKVQMIVGRNTDVLNHEGVIKASIESLAESFVDGFMAPIFIFTFTFCFSKYFKLPSLPIAVISVIIHRCINTLDSMIGYKNKKYMKFGMLSAKLDDFLNFLPARLSIPLITLSAFILKMPYKRTWRIALRDRLKHASPNSGHPESAIAAALGIQLGGKTLYRFGTVDKPYLGDSIEKISSIQIKKAGKLIMISAWLTILLSCFVITIC